MLTLCWAAKGGSGTTVTAAGVALAQRPPTLLVDLSGDLPVTLGVDAPAGPGAADWLRAHAPTDRLAGLELALGNELALLPRGGSIAPDSPRWPEFAGYLVGQRRAVVIDAGTGAPPPALVAVAGQRLLVVRNCYLNLRAAAAQRGGAPTGCVLIEEPGRRLGADDVESCLGVPVVATVLLDPAVARAVDAGLLLGRLPTGLRRPLGQLATRPPVPAAA